MMAGDDVAVAELGCNPDCDGLLPDIGAGVSRHEFLLVQGDEPLVEATNKQHPREQIDVGAALLAQRAVRCGVYRSHSTA